MALTGCHLTLLIASTLQNQLFERKKSCIKPEKKTRSHPEQTGDIFSGLDRIDDKIASYIKLAEETLNSGRFSEQVELSFENPWASKEHNPRFNHQSRTSPRS